MEGSMRDLEMIRESRDGEDGSRRLALLVLSGLAGGSLVLVLSLIAAPEAEPAPDRDPLARLSATDRLAPEVLDEELEEREPVDRVALSFPERLEGEPPELAAAIAAARAELEHPEPLPVMPAVVPPAPATERAAAALPAAISATVPTAELERPDDELLGAALPSSTALATRVPEGHDGEYTIQVISYDSPEGAHAFAEGLTSRGHRAFVMQAHVEGRGTVYRVRIGPFESMAAAQRYRATFEASEHMNTIVVRRRES
jgi:cell division septation protein DedD